MTFEDRFKEALGEWLVRTRNLDVVWVERWEEECYAASGCGTCGPEVDVWVTIVYYDSENHKRVYEYDGKLGDIVGELV